MASVSKTLSGKFETIQSDKSSRHVVWHALYSTSGKYAYMPYSGLTAGGSITFNRASSTTKKVTIKGTAKYNSAGSRVLWL